MVILARKFVLSFSPHDAELPFVRLTSRDSQLIHLSVFSFLAWGSAVSPIRRFVPATSEYRLRYSLHTGVNSC
ncbi:hypothetical protein THTE_3390 [Thermogutta terrifontis]|uniref:Uncharacterized protein n=1 Tax=Thermogutta terrifontis TaxID=1331910 RepID=A0A286RJA4_9BACT|nr:hypothetical protein THTE_3390 [Thermogutta terrifontis]